MRRGEWHATRRIGRIGTAALSLALLLAVAPAAAADPRDPELAAHIFAALEVRAQIDAIAPSATAWMLDAPSVPDADRRLLARVVARGFAADRLERASQHAFLHRVAHDDALARARIAARWLEQPLARRLHRALGADAPRGCDAVPASRTRQRLVAAIERSAGGAVRAVGHAETVVRQMAGAADALLPESQRIGRPAAAGTASQPARRDAAAACRYAQLTTGELRDALAFIESEVGRWLYDTIARSLDDALAAAARRTARDLILQLEGREPAAPITLTQATARRRPA